MSNHGAAESLDEDPGPRRLLDALPRFGPRSLAIFTALWLLALTLAIAAPIASAYYAFQRGSAPVWGPLGIAADVDGDYRVSAVNSDEARASGLLAGDRIVAIDGRPTAGRPYFLVRTWLAGSEGSAIAFTVRRGTGPPRRVVLTHRAAHAEAFFRGTGFTWRSALAVTTAAQLLPAFVLAAAAILLFRRRRERVAALLALSFLLIAATLFGSIFWEVHLPGLDSWVASAGWCGLTLVFLVFPSGRFRPRWTMIVALLLPLWLIVGGARLLSQNLENFITLLFLGLGVAALAVRYRRLPPGPERQQLRWVFLGFAFGTACVAAAVLMVAANAPLSANDPRFAVWLPMAFLLVLGAGVVAYAGGLLVSMLGYRLYDVDTVMSRSAGYAGLTLGFVAIFAASEKAVEIVGERYFQGFAGSVSGALAAAIAALLIPPMHKRMHGWAERRFQKALLHLRHDLPQCVDDLRETASMAELVDDVLARIQAGTRADSLALTIDGRTVAERGPAGRDFLVEVPLRISHRQQQVGTLLVGPRPDGSRLGKDEREALEEIADPIARAVQIVRLREARDESARKNVARLSRRLSALEKALNQSPAAPT